MEAPANFTRRLAKDFGGRLRVRWSPALQELCLEEKVGRAVLPPLGWSEGRDDLVRARDGYALVLSLKPGDRMRCPKCGHTLPVPVMRFGEAICKACSSVEGKLIAYKAAYFPLSESLLDHLHKIDPLRADSRQHIKEADQAALKQRQSAQRDIDNQIESATKDIVSIAGGFTQVGYTGREQPVGV